MTKEERAAENAREAIVAWLLEEAAFARNLSDKEPNEDQRMYRIGQHDSLTLAADAISRGEHLKDQDHGRA